MVTKLRQFHRLVHHWIHRRVHRRVHQWLIVMLILFCSLDAYAQESSVSAELSQASMAFGDSVSLIVTARNVDKAIDLSPLESQFTVTGRSSSREVRVLNGIQTAISSWVIQIEPKLPGVLTVPPISVGNFQSQPLALNVGQPPSGSSRVLFVEAFVGTNSPYVQSQVLLTIKVWQSIKVLESSKVNLGSDQFITIALEQDKQYREILDGKEYLVQEQKFALFPQASGVHTFGPIELKAKVPVDNTRTQGFFTPTRNVKRLTQPVTFNVKPRPSSTQGQWWLPASNVQILETWSGDPTNIDANETITRTIEVLATGVSVDQLPEIETPEIEGLKLYADNSDRVSTASEAGIVSSQKVTWAVVPERNGDIAIPPVNLTWFNTETGQSQVATLPAQTLSVFGVAQEATPSVALSSQRAGENSTDAANALIIPDGVGLGSSSVKPNWLWVLIGAAALACLQAIGFGFWWLSKRGSRAVKSGSQSRSDASVVPSFSRLRTAVSKPSDLAAVQGAVLDWAAKFWSDSPPKNLLIVAKRLEEPQLGQVFEQIDAVLYGASEGEVDLSAVESRMQTAASRLVDARHVVSQNSQLPAL